MKNVKIMNINGIDVLYKKVTTNNQFALIPCFKTGSVSEIESNSGITHFLEHMLLKETKTKTTEEIFDLMQKYFPNYNALTSITHMRLWFSTSLKYIDKIFEICADALMNAVFDDTKVEKERKVIEQEIVLYEAENDSVAYDDLMSNMFKYPFAKNGVLGNRDIVLNTTGANLEQRRKELVCKENLFFVFTGNYPINKVKKLFIKYFSNLPSQNAQKIEKQQLEFNGEEKVSIIKREDERCSVILGSKKCYNIKDNTEILMHKILKYYFNRQGGPLWNKLREEKGLVYAYYYNNRVINNVNFGSYECETYKANIKDCIKGYADVVSSIYKNGISEENFKDIIENFKMFNDAYIENPLKVADSIANDYIAEIDTLSIKEINTLLNSLTLEQFNKFAKENVYSSFLTLSVVGNADETDVYTIEEIKQMLSPNYNA